MSNVSELPPVVAVAVGLLVLFGSVFAFIGGLGLLRFRKFYQRVHAPTLGTSFGVASIVLASVLSFSASRSTLALGAILVFILITLTAPVGLLLLVRAAVVRDRAEANPDVPQL